jgi:hypothetical protein
MAVLIQNTKKCYEIYSIGQVNVAVTLWNCIRRVLGSNFGCKPAVVTLGTSWSSSVPPDNFRDSVSIVLRPLSSKSLRI